MPSLIDLTELLRGLVPDLETAARTLPECHAPDTSS